MGRLSENYELGNAEDMEPEEFLRRIQEMYTELARAINRKPDLVFITSGNDMNGNPVPADGDNTETFLSNGTININTFSDKVEIITDHPTASTVNWVTLG